jgi:hypothetical protein
MAFIAGMCMLIGTWGTFQFFIRRSKIRGSIFYFSGLFLIIVGIFGFTIIGFSLQTYGVFQLFR